MKKNTSSFASRWGFILASVGSAVGMANVWGFPNKMGSNGGGAFLLIYLLFVFIFSYVGLPAEFAMGRRAATGTLGTYKSAWATRGKGCGKAGAVLGWLPLAGSLCIAIGYAVIVTYVLKALVDSLAGTLMSADTAAWFGEFSSKPYSVVPYHIIVVAGTLLTLFLGAHSIEKTNKVMMPLTSMRARYREVFFRLGLGYRGTFRGFWADTPPDPAVYARATPPRRQGETWIGIAPFAKHRGKIYPEELMVRVVRERVERGVDNWYFSIFCLLCVAVTMVAAFLIPPVAFRSKKTPAAPAADEAADE